MATVQVLPVDSMVGEPCVPKRYDENRRSGRSNKDIATNDKNARAGQRTNDNRVSTSAVAVISERSAQSTAVVRFFLPSSEEAKGGDSCPVVAVSCPPSHSPVVQCEG